MSEEVSVLRGGYKGAEACLGALDAAVAAVPEAMNTASGDGNMGELSEALAPFFGYRDSCA